MEAVVYILHSEADVAQEQALAQQLAVFARVHKVLRLLHTPKFGQRTLAQQNHAIDQADIVVLLITPAFWDIYELALRVMAQKKLVVPVLVRSTPWVEVPLGKVRPLPSDSRFIDEWENKDAAWLDVAQGLKGLWESIDLAALRSAFVNVGAEAPLVLPDRLVARPVSPNERVRVLLVSANPSLTGRQHFTQQAHALQQCLRRSPNGARFELILQSELRSNELAIALMRHKPHIVHFSGCGEGIGVLSSVENQSQQRLRPMDSQALGQLFSILRDSLQFVVLSGCYSSAHPQQAQALAEAAGCAICVGSELGAASVAQFDMAFYDALAFGRSVAEALELAKTALVAAGTMQARVAQLIAHRGHRGVDLLPPLLTEISTAVERSSEPNAVPELSIEQLASPVNEANWGLRLLLGAGALGGALASLMSTGNRLRNDYPTAVRAPVPDRASPSAVTSVPLPPMVASSSPSKPAEVLLPRGIVHPRKSDHPKRRTGPELAPCLSSACAQTGSTEQYDRLVSEGVAACKAHNQVTAQIKYDMLGAEQDRQATLQSACKQYDVEVN